MKHAQSTTPPGILETVSGKHGWDSEILKQIFSGKTSVSYKKTGGKAVILRITSV